jgi:cobalt/nickel transport system permease protein
MSRTQDQNRGEGQISGGQGPVWHVLDVRVTLGTDRSMHIPDGFLTPPVWATLDAVSLAAIGAVARRASREVNEMRVPLLGVMGAFVFAAQMINFPVGPGTSGHLVGAAFLAAVLGPAAASVVMTAILLIQAFVFQDGGVLALGANVLNMGLVGVVVGYLPYHLMGNSGRWRALGLFLGGLLSVSTSALLAVGELRLSGVPMSGMVLSVSAFLFVVAGVLEGAITLSVVAALDRLHPGWVQRPSASGGKALWITATAAIGLAAVGVWFASASPDGLESLLGQLGVSKQAYAAVPSAFPDYEMRWVDSMWLRKSAAGLAGLGLIYGACTLIGRIVARPRSSD